MAHFGELTIFGIWRFIATFIDCYAMKAYVYLPLKNPRKMDVLEKTAKEITDETGNKVIKYITRD